MGCLYILRFCSQVEILVDIVHLVYSKAFVSPVSLPRLGLCFCHLVGLSFIYVCFCFDGRLLIVVQLFITYRR